MTKQKRAHLTLLTNTADSRTIRREVRVEITKFASKQIERLPEYLLEHVQEWMRSLKEVGLENTRKNAGYHDEPLKGHREGQRSIRLNRSWRLIYEEYESENETWVMITVLEVNKHAY